MQISSTFWIPYIADWQLPTEEMHSKYIDFSKVSRDKVSVIPLVSEWHPVDLWGDM
jgi:hypothetical protein